MPETALARRIDAVRRFNRFYTRKIGVLQQGLLRSPFSLTEVRVLYELAHRKDPTATELRRELALDPGYLSRMLRSFEKRGLISRKPSEADSRQSPLRLTSSGRKVFASLNTRARQQVRTMLQAVPHGEEQRLLQAMHTVESVLGDRSNPGRENRAAYRLRPHQPGDMGWVVHRHGALYAEEYGYDERFEALVAQIVADFLRKFDPQRERCWIAEMNGEIVGSVFLVRQSAAVAKLRLLLVEPKARGLGLGGRLVNECVNFARQAGYKKITLWTQSELHSARHLYKKAGFRLVGTKRHQDFGKPSLAEVWDLKL